MMRKIWYFGVYYFRLIFTSDPVAQWINDIIGELALAHKEHAKSLELENERLRIKLDEARTDYILLQEEFIKHLKGPEEIQQITTSYQMPQILSRPTSFSARRSKLEAAAASKANQNIHEKIAAMEADLEIQGSPDPQINLAPSSESHGI